MYINQSQFISDRNLFHSLYVHADLGNVLFVLKFLHFAKDWAVQCSHQCEDLGMQKINQ